MDYNNPAAIGKTATEDDPHVIAIIQTRNSLTEMAGRLNHLRKIRSDVNEAIDQTEKELSMLVGPPKLAQGNYNPPQPVR